MIRQKRIERFYMVYRLTCLIGVFFVVLGNMVLLYPKVSTAMTSEDSWRERNNALHLRVGSHYFKETAKTDLWGMNDSSLIDAFLELGYERLILDINPAIK